MAYARHPRGPRAPAQVSIVPNDPDFSIRVNGSEVLSVEDELDAHHWAKHVTECVNLGITHVPWIREALPRVCRTATINNLHTGFPAAS